MLYPIQYISQGETVDQHLQNIKAVCTAGGRWIQLRLKNVEHKVYLEAAKQCKIICKQHNATLIINDNVPVAHQSDADGVHLGLGDINPKEAREILGAHKIIGGTANSLGDCIQHISDGVNYIGLGPFRFTTTKKNLSPVLGVEGYEKILHALQSSTQQVPIVAIGGIQLNDISALKNTGISGIALSGFISNISTEELTNRLKQMTQLLNSSKKEMLWH